MFLCTTEFLNIKEASCYVHTQGNQVPCGEASARLKVGDASVRGSEDGGDTSADRETQTGGPGQWTDPSHIQVNFLSKYLLMIERLPFVFVKIPGDRDDREPRCIIVGSLAAGHSD